MRKTEREHLRVSPPFAEKVNLFAIIPGNSKSTPNGREERDTRPEIRVLSLSLSLSLSFEGTLSSESLPSTWTKKLLRDVCSRQKRMFVKRCDDFAEEKKVLRRFRVSSRRPRARSLLIRVIFTKSRFRPKTSSIKQRAVVSLLSYDFRHRSHLVPISFQECFSLRALRSREGWS